MSTVCRHPSQEILTACDLLDAQVAKFLDARKTVTSLGKWESEMEAWSLLNLVIRHIDSVVALARCDLVLIPSAMAVTRTCFETAVKAAWILTPGAEFDREVRWLAQLKTEIDFNRRLSKQLTRAGVDSTSIDSVAASIQKFHDGLAALLPKGHTKLTDVPNLFDMLKSMNQESWYMFYVVASQYSHASHFATGLFKKNLGTSKEYGEFVRPGDWAICLQTCWYSLHMPGRLWLQRCKADESEFFEKDSIGRLETALRDIKD